MGSSHGAMIYLDWAVRVRTNTNLCLCLVFKTVRIGQTRIFIYTFYAILDIVSKASVHFLFCFVLLLFQSTLAVFHKGKNHIGRSLLDSFASVTNVDLGKKVGANWLLRSWT